MLARISADKGVSFDFTNNEKLKNSSFAVEGSTVNGYVTADGITLNIDSAKSLNSVVGHEITHILEGTDLYNSLQQTIIKYAKTKGDYQGRYDTLSKLYEGIEGTNVDNELTADLVGDYLFTDSEFINNLSTEQPNLFKRIYNEIKYLCKVATAGSKEARELEKVKRAFDKAYKESVTAQKNTTDKGDVKYSFGVSQSEINDYVEAAYAKENTEDYKKYAEPSERLLNDVANEIDIDGYSHALRDNDIRHIRNSHGEETNEKYPVTKDDIKLIPWIVENYDKVFVKTNAKNQPGIVYVKVMPDNIIYYVEAVTEEYHKEKLLINKQMLKAGIDEIPNLHGLIAAINKKTSSSQYLADLEKIRKAYVRDVKENYSNDILPRNYEKSSGKEKYSLSPAELDKQYLSAVKNNDIATAQKIVDDVAKENGYNSPILYHGTHSFGFTTFDLEKMDDKRSIFLTSNPNIASTYSGTTGTKNIGNEIKNISNMSGEELVNELNEYDKQYKNGTTEGAHRYELYDLQKTNKLIDSVNSGIETLKTLVDEQIKNYADKIATDFEEKDARIHRQLICKFKIH